MHQGNANRSRKKMRSVTPPPFGDIPVTNGNNTNNHLAMDPYQAVYAAQEFKQNDGSGVRHNLYTNNENNTNAPGSGSNVNHLYKRRLLESATSSSLTQEVHKFIDDLLHTGSTMWQNLPREDPSSVEVAISETLHVLLSCWTFNGKPQDAFESINGLSQITVELLLQYGKHVLTPDGKYLVLQGGVEDMPWVGCLLVALNSYLGKNTSRRNRINSPFKNWNQNIAKTVSTQDQKVRIAGEPIYRVLLLNCHNFGWLDSIGNENYENSSHYLLKVNNTLRDLVHDNQFNQVLYDDANVNPTGRIFALLSNVILIGGGLPSLSLTAHSQVFSAHHQYGRGMACMIPSMPSAKSSLLTDSRGLFTRSKNNGNDEDAATDAESPSNYYAPLCLSSLKPVSCGVRSTFGLAAHAILFAPSGPLVIHVEFEKDTSTQFGNNSALPFLQNPSYELPTFLHAFLHQEQFPYPEGFNAFDLLEFIGWIVHLLSSPQPTLFVEWQLNTPRSCDAPLGIGPTVQGSLIFEMLHAFRGYDVSRLSNCVEGGRSINLPAMVGSMKSILRTFTRCEATKLFDANERPVVLVKELEVMAETEKFVTEHSVISSIQIRRAV